jgi:hypothetical protein
LAGASEGGGVSVPASVARAFLSGVIGRHYCGESFHLAKRRPFVNGTLTAPRQPSRWGAVRFTSRPGVALDSRAVAVTLSPSRPTQERLSNVDRVERAAKQAETVATLAQDLAGRLPSVRP